MTSAFDGNCSSYWPYSPYPYCNSYDTSSSNSSYFESPLSSASSPRMMMFPVYEQQQQGCYYYSDPAASCYQFTPPSPPMLPQPPVRPCVEPFYSSSPPLQPRTTTNLPNRLQYTNRQRWLLNEIFEHVPYPNSVQKNVVADRIGATREQIRKSSLSPTSIDSHVRPNRYMVSKPSTHRRARPSQLVSPVQSPSGERHGFGAVGIGEHSARPRCSQERATAYACRPGHSVATCPFVEEVDC